MSACVKGNKVDEALSLFSLMTDTHNGEAVKRDGIASDKNEEKRKGDEVAGRRDEEAPGSLEELSKSDETLLVTDPGSSPETEHTTALSTPPSSVSSSSSTSSASSSASYPPLIRNAYSYGTALHALGKKKAWREALDLLEQLDPPTGRTGGRTHGVEKTIIMVSAL